jgi:predicted Zn-dependent protease with MMP-like domain
MVGIAQSVERLVVVQEAAGSSPVTHPMEWPSLDEFESMVVAELDALPDDMVAGLDNVAIFVEDTPPDGEEILGLYEGVALTERGDYGLGELPDRVVIFRTPLLEMARDREHLAAEIRITLIHEIAHYYGIDDGRLHELGWA